MKKKVLFFLLLVALVGALFIGCERGSQQREVSLWYWDVLVSPDFEVMKREFEQANPGHVIEFSVTPFAQYWTNLQTALPTGAGPDIFWLNHPYAVSYMPTGQVMNLEPWADTINFNNFERLFVEPFTHNGARYAIPFMWDSNVLFFNKAHFDAAGIPYPNENWTWDDFYDAARRLTIRSGNTTTQYGAIVHHALQSGVGPFILQNGEPVYNADRTRLNLNNPRSIEAIQRNLDLIIGGFAPTAQMVAEATDLALFSSGAASMLTAHSIRVSHFADGLGRDLGVSHLPQGRRRATVIHNIAHSAATRTRNTEGTRALMEFIATRRLAEIISKTFAPCYTGASDLYFQEYAWAGAMLIPSTVNYGFPLQISSRNAGPVNTLLNNEMQRIFSTAGTANLAAQIAELETLINAEINR